VSDRIADLADVAFRPEDDPVFRMSQLLLLLDELSPKSATLDRLTYYDFFSESPYLLFDEGAPERATLRLAGFESGALSYLSPAQRFVTRQERVSGDLAALVAYRLTDVRISDRSAEYSITARGSAISRGLTAMYADSYRTSAQLVLKRLQRLSNTRLHSEARGLVDFDGNDLMAVADREESA
jgi:hypothetical protein